MNAQAGPQLILLRGLSLERIRSHPNASRGGDYIQMTTSAMPAAPPDASATEAENLRFAIADLWSKHEPLPKQDVG